MDYFYYTIIAFMVGQLIIFVVGQRRLAASRQKQVNLLERIAEALEKR